MERVRREGGEQSVLSLCHGPFVWQWPHLYAAVGEAASRDTADISSDHARLPVAYSSAKLLLEKSRRLSLLLAASRAVDYVLGFVCVSVCLCIIEFCKQQDVTKTKFIHAVRLTKFILLTYFPRKLLTFSALQFTTFSHFDCPLRRLISTSLRALLVYISVIINLVCRLSVNMRILSIINC